MKEGNKRRRAYTEFERKILERTKGIEELVASMDDNNDELKDELDECNDEMQSLGEEKRNRNLP